MTPEKEAKRLRELCVDGEHTWEFCENEIEIALRRAAGPDDTPDYERGYSDGHHEATEDYLRCGGEARCKRIAQRAAYLIASNIVWLEDQAVQRSIELDIEGYDSREFF